MLRYLIMRMILQPDVLNWQKDETLTFALQCAFYPKKYDLRLISKIQITDFIEQTIKELIRRQKPELVETVLSKIEKEKLEEFSHLDYFKEKNRKKES